MKSFPSATKEFIFGSFIYQYQLILQDRKTLSLTVTPNLRIHVKSPMKADAERIEAFLKRKWFWLEKQLSFFKKYQRRLYKKEYVSGESFIYLGRQYKLVVRHGKEDDVAMEKGQIIVNTSHHQAETRYIKRLLSSWYGNNTQRVLRERYEVTQKRFEYTVIPKLVIREMQKRWGSFASKEKIILNPNLIHVPKQCIDYVIVHELCHITYKNHNKNFFALLKKKYPGWDKVKEKLERIGAMIE